MTDYTEEEGREVQSMEADAGLVSVISRAEIDQQIATAHKYPRSITKFRKAVTEMVTISEAVAEECIYSLPRDGKTIVGPSARFAEVINSAWGNSRAGARTVNESGEFVIAQGVFHDLERNTAITYEVQRRIVDKQGRKFKTDMIGVTANAACSIALRNAILKGVPKAFWSEMFERAKEVVRGDFETLPNRRAKAFARLVTFGVTQEQIFATLGCNGEQDIGLDHLVTLKGLITALKEGDTTVEQAFGRGAEDSGLRKPQAKPAADPAAQAPPAAAAVAPVSTEPTPVTASAASPGQADLLSSGAPAATTGAEAAGPAATPGTLAMIRRKGVEAGFDEAAICMQFDLQSLEGISAAKGVEILKFFAPKP